MAKHDLLNVDNIKKHIEEYKHQQCCPYFLFHFFGSPFKSKRLTVTVLTSIEIR